MTLVAAAVCPHPPLLVPEVGRGEPVAVRAAAVAAVRSLIASRPDRIVLVGDAPAAVAYSPDAAGTLAGFGVDLTVPLGPPPADDQPADGPPAGTPEPAASRLPAAVAPAAAGSPSPSLPLSLTVGAWLLAAAGWTGARAALGVPAAHSARQAADLGACLVGELDPRERLALLVMGDGSARRTLKAPGGLDERAGAFDAAAAAALAGPDPAGLLALDPTLATDLLAAGRASWQVLAGALLAANRAGRQRSAAAWTSDLLYDDAPYGVGYLVAVWTGRDARGDRTAP